MSCYCQVGLHHECISWVTDDAGNITCCCSRDVFMDAPTSVPVAVETHTRQYKQDQDVGNVLSTGRKRAASLFPVSDGMLCEWAFLSFAGGGPVPIVGCPGNTLLAGRGNHAVHHGPDKNTLNNSPLDPISPIQNVHRICPVCHNRWHELNDPFYGKRPTEGLPFLPLISGEVTQHDKETRASEEVVLRSEAWWSTPLKIRGAYSEVRNVGE